MKNKKKLTSVIILVLSIFIVALGISFAYFTADIYNRQLTSEVGGVATGTGFGNSNTGYALIQKIYAANIPSIKCAQKNDRFTVLDTVKGNGALTYPIGLLTPDEGLLARFIINTSNSTNYLRSNTTWWTLGPSNFDGSQPVGWVINSVGRLNNSFRTNYSHRVRGVLNLKSETQVTGTGTTSDPFKVV